MNSCTAGSGYVPQEQILFSKSVRENIQFGQPAPAMTIMQAITVPQPLTGISAPCPTGWIQWLENAAFPVRGTEAAGIAVACLHRRSRYSGSG